MALGRGEGWEGGELSERRGKKEEDNGGPRAHPGIHHPATRPHPVAGDHHPGAYGVGRGQVAACLPAFLRVIFFLFLFETASKMSPRV